MKLTPIPNRLQLLTLAVSSLASLSNAATRTWSGLIDGNWSIGGAGGNWTDAAAPVNNDALVFAGTTNATTNNDIANLTVGNANNSNTTVALTFSNTGDGENIILAGNAINLNGAIRSGNVSGGSSIIDVIDLDIILTGTGNRRITSGNNHDLTINGLVSGGGSGTFILEKFANGGVGIVKLTNGANSYTKNLSLFDGHAQITSIADIGVNSAAGAGTAIQVGGGSVNSATLEYIGTTNSSSNRVIIMNGNNNNTTANILNNGTGTLALSGNFNSTNTGASQTKFLNLGGTNTGNNTLSGVLDNRGGGSSNGTLAVTKSDAGKWILSGANTYTGDTTVNEGILQIDNPFLNDDSTVTIASGAIMDLNFTGTDIIASLDLGGTIFTVGTFSASSPAPYGAFFTGTGELTISGDTPYDTWATGAFTNPFADTDPDTDFDNDGLSNLLEFVLGGDPTINQPGICPVGTVSGSDLILTFNRSDQSLLDPAINLTVQISEDLTSWPTASDIVIGATSDAGPIGDTASSYTVSDSGSLDTIVVTIPNGATTKRFARIIATQP